MRHLALFALLFAGCRSASTAESAPRIEVIALQNAGAPDLANEIRAILSQVAAKGGTAPTVSIIADPRTNSLLVHADTEDMAQIRELVAQLDRRVTEPGR